MVGKPFTSKMRSRFGIIRYSFGKTLKMTSNRVFSPFESCARGLLALRHSMGFLVEGWFSVALAVDSRNGGGWPTFLRLRLFFAGLDCLLLFLKISHQLGSFLRQCRHF